MAPTSSMHCPATGRSEHPEHAEHPEHPEHPEHNGEQQSPARTHEAGHEAGRPVDEVDPAARTRWHLDREQTHLRTSDLEGATVQVSLPAGPSEHRKDQAATLGGCRDIDLLVQAGGAPCRGHLDPGRRPAELRAREGMLTLAPQHHGLVGLGLLDPPVCRRDSLGQAVLHDDRVELHQVCQRRLSLAVHAPDVAVAALLGEAVVLHAEAAREGQEAHAGVVVDCLHPGWVVHAARKEVVPLLLEPGGVAAAGDLVLQRLEVGELHDPALAVGEVGPERGDVAGHVPDA